MSFTLQHLNYLQQHGLALPPQIGMIPINHPNQNTVADLHDWKLLTTTDKPTEGALDYFKTVLNPEEIYYGVIMLNNQNWDLNVDIPEQLVQYQLEKAFSNIPRVNWSVFVNGFDATTCVLSNGDNFVEFQHLRSDTRNDPELITNFLLNILDPRNQFPPAPIGIFRVPFRDLKHLIVTPDDDVDSEEDIAEFTELVEQQHPDVKEMLLWDNIASCEINYTTETVINYRVLQNPSASIVIFFEQGMVVSYPYRDYSGETSIQYAPGESENIDAAIIGIKHYYQGGIE